MSGQDRDRKTEQDADECAGQCHLKGLKKTYENDRQSSEVGRKHVGDEPPHVWQALDESTIELGSANGHANRHGADDDQDEANCRRPFQNGVASRIAGCQT